MICRRSRIGNGRNRETQTKVCATSRILNSGPSFENPKSPVQNPRSQCHLQNPQSHCQLSKVLNLCAESSISMPASKILNLLPPPESSSLCQFFQSAQSQCRILNLNASFPKSSISLPPSESSSSGHLSRILNLHAESSSLCHLSKSLNLHAIFPRESSTKVAQALACEL